MNKQKIIKQLKQKYPDKKIILNDEKNPTEIICEIDPTINHPEYSICIAVIDKSIPHYHKHTIETYEAIKGKLILHINDKVIETKEGDKTIINPNKTHWAEGQETWIKTTSKPGWTIEDHITAK